MSKFKAWLYRFMAGRRGMDQFGMALYVTGLVLYILALFTRLGILNLLSLAMWIYAIYRAFSRNLARREKENRWFLAKYQPLKRRVSQAWVRFKNRKVYKYYRCPKCKSWLKLPRHVGEKTVTCGKCGATFTKKA
ncbi:MAG: hypothetical protein J6U63_00570 [Clostridia bacterium]|jgi:hypothetical protein|nr:hypothetical protein [Clostridia bacterium]MBQ4450906.1 hypothetical protein [Clostridia bacterium]